jgi:hypothetical protein
MTQVDEESVSDLPWRAPPTPAPEVSAAIRETCTRDLGKRPGLSAMQRTLLSILVSGAVVGVTVMAAVRHGQPQALFRFALIGALGWGLVHAAILTGTLARPPGRRGSRALRVAIAVAIPATFFLYLALAATSRFPIARFMHEGLGRAGECSLYSLAFGVIAAGATLLLWRRTDPLTPGLSGALAGLLGGLASAVGVGIACPTHESWHLWLVHGMTVVLFVGVGWAVGRKWLAP